MTNRIPLIINSGTGQIQELPAGDNLNLSDNNIVGVIDITANGNATVDAIFTDNYYYANGAPLSFTGSGIALTDISVTTSAPSGNGSLSYDNTTGVFTFAPANIQATVQNLTWDVANTTLTISDGNSVDLSALQNSNYGNTEVQAYLDAQGYSNVQYSNTEVQAYLDAQGYSNVDSDAQTLTFDGANLSISGGNSVDLTALAGGNVDLSSYATTSDLTTANTNMQAYVDAEIASLLGGANVNLDSLAEVANALANSNAELSTVAFTGSYNDLQNKPSLALSGNTYLTLDGANIDLSSVVGQQGLQGNVGPAGNDGADGVSVSSAIVTGSNLIITLSDSSTIDAGDITGPAGPAGSDGADGADGADGISITNATLVGSNLTITYSNTSVVDVGNIEGPKGDDGVSVSSASVNGSGNLIITLTDANTIDAGNVKGADGLDGADGIQLSDISVTTATASGNGSLSYDNTTGVLTFTPADLSGVQSNYGNVEVQAYLDAQGYSNVDNDAQTLSLTGNVITISGSGSSVDLTSALSNASVDLTGYATESYVTTANTNMKAYVDSELANVSGGGGSGIALTDLSGGTGIDYNSTTGEIALADTSVSAGTYGSSTTVPRLTVDGQGRITSITTQAVSGSGGGGSSFEYFKINYTSAGAIDTAVGTGGISNISANMGNVTVQNAASNACEIVIDFGGNYNFPPLSVICYGLAQATSEYNIKHMTQNTINTTLKLDGSGDPHGNLGSANLTMSLTRAETGSSSNFGHPTHAWIYFVMGS